MQFASENAAWVLYLSPEERLFDRGVPSMMLFSPTLLVAAALSTVAWAQQSPWGQCGGKNWTGLTSCTTGYHCHSYNEWYSQCVPTCGATTVYTSSGVVATGVTAIPTVITQRASAFYSTGYRTACASTGSGGTCAYSTTLSYTLVADFFGRTLTTTITKPIQATTVTSVPVATTTIPCYYKRDAVEERAVIEAK